MRVAAFLPLLGPALPSRTVVQPVMEVIGMRILLVFLALSAAACARYAPPPASVRAATADTSVVRRELLAWYAQNIGALRAKDVDAFMALRTDDFHAVTPDGAVRDRAEMELATRGLFNGIERWIDLGFELDSLEVSGDLAHAIVRQHVVRMALRSDGRVHHVETWVTQRETWRRTAAGWRMYRVDGLRDQRRLIDGEPG